MSKFFVRQSFDSSEIILNFIARMKVDGSCWIWTGAKDRYGYGKCGLLNQWTAHRVSFILFVGPIPNDKQIDHLCRNRMCVNPNHMELVTLKENVLRGEGFTAKHKRKTHCIRGHEFTPENTYIRPKGRECRKCMTKGRN